MKEKLLILMLRRSKALDDLQAPARAAFHQMQDANLHRGAAPLGEVLFQLDAIDAELKELVESDPGAAIDAAMKWIMP